MVKIKMNTNLYANKLYLDDVNYVAEYNLPWDILQDKSIIITGATGLIGSFLVDVLMTKNTAGLNCTVYAVSRDVQRATKRFVEYDSSFLKLITYDVNTTFVCKDIVEVDYVLHLASNTHPFLYSVDPIGTITTNIIGLQNMLEVADKYHAKRFVFASSNEIYGENRGDIELFDEDYCGYINSNSLRAGYPESKRCGEALCQAYKEQKGLDVVIPRITRTYGPTMSMDDTKAISQFLKKGIKGEDIILKSSGTQYYSFTYVADAVNGLLHILFKGKNGEAYNISDEKSDIMLKDLAEIVANIVGRKVVFERPDSIEAAGYSKATKARLNGDKLVSLGWSAKYDIRSGVERTIEILRRCYN